MPQLKTRGAILEKGATGSKARSALPSMRATLAHSFEQTDSGGD